MSSSLRKALDLIDRYTAEYHEHDLLQEARRLIAQASDKRPMLDRHGVAYKLGVSERTVIRLQELGALPAVRLPTGSMRYHPDRVDALLQEDSASDDDDPRREALTDSERNPTLT